MVFLRLCDGNKARLGKVYFRTKELMKTLEGLKLPAAKKNAVLELCTRRVDMLLNRLHKAAYCVDPTFWKENLAV